MHSPIPAYTKYAKKSRPLQVSVREAVACYFINLFLIKMFGNIILRLTFLSYLLLLPFNLYRTEGTAEQNTGYLIAFYILVAYMVLSLILTIIIAVNGGFNWISDVALNRNIGANVLWLGTTAGIIICSMIKADIREHTEYLSYGLEKLAGYALKSQAVNKKNIL